MTDQDIEKIAHLAVAAYQRGERWLKIGRSLAWILAFVSIVGWRARAIMDVVQDGLRDNVKIPQMDSWAYIVSDINPDVTMVKISDTSYEIPKRGRKSVPRAEVLREAERKRQEELGAQEPVPR